MTQSILFCNQSTMGKRVVIAPGTSAVDGIFQVVRFRHGSAAGILKTLGHLKTGSPLSEKWLDRNEIEKGVFEFEQPAPAFGDGEEFPPQLRWELACHRGSIQMRVPSTFSGVSA